MFTYIVLVKENLLPHALFHVVQYNNTTVVQPNTVH